MLAHTRTKPLILVCWTFFASLNIILFSGGCDEPIYRGTTTKSFSFADNGSVLLNLESGSVWVTNNDDDNVYITFISTSYSKLSQKKADILAIDSFKNDFEHEANTTRITSKRIGNGDLAVVLKVPKETKVSIATMAGDISCGYTRSAKTFPMLNDSKFASLSTDNGTINLIGALNCGKYTLSASHSINIKFPKGTNYNIINESVNRPQIIKDSYTADKQSCTVVHVTSQKGDVVLSPY